MKITRSADSIKWQDERSVGVAFTIKLEDNIDWNRKELNQKWVDYCAEHIVAGTHSTEETIAWMQERWDVIPLEDDNRHVKIQYGTLVMNFCKDKLTHKDMPLSMEMSDEEFIRWHKESEALSLEAQEMPEEVSGLNIYGFQILPTERNLPDMLEDAEAFDRRFPPRPEERNAEHSFNSCYIFFEETHGLISHEGVGCGIIGRKIAAYQGISREDINARSPLFISYLHSADHGLPTFEKYLLINQNEDNIY